MFDVGYFPPNTPPVGIAKPWPTNLSLLGSPYGRIQGGDND
jgi:hypothetical protein